MSAVLVLCLVSYSVVGFGAPILTGQGGKMKNAVVPVYVGEPPQLGAKFRIGRIFTDYQRKGFLRIGVLPMLVAEDVTVEIHRPEALAELLSSFQRWPGNGPSRKVVEWRNVRFIPKGGTGFRLEAASMRLDRHGQMCLTGVRYCKEDASVVELSAAILEVTGEAPGTLRWESEGQTSVSHLLRQQITP